LPAGARATVALDRGCNLRLARADSVVVGVGLRLRVLRSSLARPLGVGPGPRLACFGHWRFVKTYIALE
jgi:hypothetical protein